MEIEKKRSRGWLIFCAVILTATLIAAAAAAVFFLLPPSGGIDPPESGVGLTSAAGGREGWMSGGRNLRLLAIAVQRGWKTDDPRFSEPLAALQFEKDGAPAAVTLFRDPETGDLAFSDPSGQMRTHFQKYLRWLLEGDGGAFDSLLNETEPGPVTVAGQQVFAYSYDYLGSSLFGEPLRFTGADESAAERRFVLDSTQFPIDGLPAAARITVLLDGAAVYTGLAGEYQGFPAESHTDYEYRVEVASDSGSAAEYRFTAFFELSPEFSVSSGTVNTGDVLVLTVDGVREGDSVRADVPLEFAPQFVVRNGVATAMVPFNHAFAPGAYQVTLHCNDYSETFDFTVNLVEYGRQDLTITGEGAAANTEDANREYAERIVPLFQNFDPEIYWDGLFIQPAAGSITTDFGIYRYTNGSETPSRHAAVDIANAEGTEIAAPNNGRVLFADFLELSGNTVLIEHGRGLHTLYMHMASLDVAAGDAVQKGQRLGAMGTTGYSTGPHLHYQMMLMDFSISPWFAQDGSSGFYALSAAAAPAPEA